MFSKISFILLTIGLCGIVKGTPLSDLSTNTEKCYTNLLGVYCMVESVLDLENTADEFSYQITKRCGAEAAANLTKELSDVTTLMQLTSNITDINDNVCDNADFKINENSNSTSPTPDCVNQLRAEMEKLNTSYRNTRTDINNGLKQDYSKPACVQMAMTNIKFLLVIYPQRIEVCANLVS